MKNNERASKFGSKKLWMAIGIVLTVILVFVAGGAAGRALHPNGDKPAEERNTETTVENGGMTFSDEEAGYDEGSFARTVLSVEQFAEYAVPASAESAVVLTATITPSYASIKELDWSAAWANAESDWATDKILSDYVTVTPTEDGALTATVACLQAFGEQIIVTATARGNESKKATCTLEYLQRYLGTSTKLGNPGSPYQNLDFSTTVEGGTITSDLWENIAYPCEFMNHSYVLEKSETYTLPLTGNGTVQYYVKCTEDFASRLNMENKMMSYQLEPQTDWVLVDYSVIDLSQNSADLDFWKGAYSYGVPYYLDLVCGGLDGEQNKFSDQYSGFADAVRDINHAPYSDKICFEIKIVTTIGEDTFESVTQVKLNEVTIIAAVEDVELDHSSYIF